MQTAGRLGLTKLNKSSKNQMKASLNFWKIFIRPRADPEAPANARMVNMRKLQKLDGALGMNPSQLVDVAFKVLNNREILTLETYFTQSCPCIFLSSSPPSAHVLASSLLCHPSLFWRSLTYQLSIWDQYSWVWHHPMPFLPHHRAYSVIKCHIQGKGLWVLET